MGRKRTFTLTFIFINFLSTYLPSFPKILMASWRGHAHKHNQVKSLFEVTHGIGYQFSTYFYCKRTNNCTWNVKGDFPCSDIEVVFKQRPWVKKRICKLMNGDKVMSWLSWLTIYDSIFFPKLLKIFTHITKIFLLCASFFGVQLQAVIVI